MTTICFDFGNSRLKAGIFTGQMFTKEIEMPDDHPETILQIIKEYKPEKTILTSVIHHHPELENRLAANSRFHKLTHESKLNFKIASGKPESIGTDRLALVAAAVHCFPGKNNLIISLGTCITYNFVNQDGVFLGGAISPGQDLRFKSMNDYTALLPLVKTNWNYPLIGYDTPTNLQSGVVHGIIGEILHFIELYKEKYGNFNVVLTGGNAPYFASRLKSGIFADIHFLYKGLYALSETNN
jgi:type III pantothenate kinase